jgi:succinate dehydrogenase hydrophobic anchor subunit
MLWPAGDDRTGSGVATVVAPVRRRAPDSDPEPPPAVPAPPPEGTAVQTAVQVLGAVAGPLTLLTALLFYFGWTRTNELYARFGIDASTLGFTSQDYLLRSFEAVYLPLSVLLVASIAALWVHGGATAWMRRADPRATRIAVTALLVAGLVLFVRGVAGVIDPDVSRDDFLVTPLSLAVGTAMLAYGRHLRRLDRRLGGDRRRDDSRWLRIIATSLVLMLIVLNLFWAATVYAQAYGRGRASQFARDLAARPGVIVYSVDRLFVDEPGVTEEALPGGAGYRFRYEGLRLLIHSDDRYFLLPAGWAPGVGSTVVLRDSERVRLEFVPGG